MMIIYMQLNTYMAAWAQAATWLSFLSVIYIYATKHIYDRLGSGSDLVDVSLSY